MLSKETFINYIDLVKELFDRIDKLSDDVSLMLYSKKYNVNLFDSDWWTTTDKIINVFFTENFTDDGIDWINYFLYEDIQDKRAIVKGDIFEGEIEYPLTTVEELWNFLCSNKALYFKNGRS